MIRQDDLELNLSAELPFEEFACKLFCLFYFSEQIINTFYDPDTIIDRTLRFLNKGWINCELAVYGIVNTKAILVDLQVPVKAVKTASASYRCKPNELEILKLTKPGYMHFVPGDGHGNYTWDSLGLRPGQDDYKLTAKRIIVLEDNWHEK